jgi:hypothetical protein
MVSHQAPFCIWWYYPVVGGVKQFVGKMLASQSETNIDVVGFEPTTT